jgi:hypothetical protein
MTKKDSSRETNPPYLGDYHRMRLYPRHWDKSSFTGQNSSTKAGRQLKSGDSRPEDDDKCAAPLPAAAFDDWQISRHYPDDDTYRCDTFAAF